MWVFYIGFGKDRSVRRDSLIRPHLLLQLADGDHQRHAGVGARFRLGGTLAGAAESDRREAQQANGENRQQNHQGKCGDKGEAVARS